MITISDRRKEHFQCTKKVRILIDLWQNFWEIQNLFSKLFSFIVRTFMFEMAVLTMRFRGQFEHDLIRLEIYGPNHT